jgi:hypothetical protein
MRSGTVETMLERTRYAAVTAAASFEAVEAKPLSRRYGRRCLGFGAIALTASWTAPWTIPMLIWRAGGAPFSSLEPG